MSADDSEIIQITVQREEIEKIAEVVRLSSAAPGRISYLLKIQMYAHWKNPNLHGHIPRIVAEIDHLEGNGRNQHSKRAEQFRKLPLRGFYKTHYLLGAHSLPANILIEMDRNKAQIENSIRRLFEIRDAGATDDELFEESGRVAREVVNLYALRGKKNAITGEWLIFAKHEGQNYYLTLATHQQAKGKGDNSIYRLIMDGCAWEFPFLDEYAGRDGDQSGR